jgi:hypothetical protein
MTDTYDSDSDYGSDHTGFDGSADDVSVDEVDYDRDGTVDTVVYTDESTGESLVLMDSDKDAAADLLGVDVDGDQQLDIAVARQGDDSYVVWADENQDGEVNRGEQAVLTRAELEDLIPGAADLLDQKITNV